ncbi:hypothetical protein COLO4_29879 [Corchorus olitorius]|uniref:Uncharacterized protein n=1 Tax=Corchorus olitorius TaxID=93759 RepID=A0A1R3HCP7_9ROSI|nr:hypothetical protein COLO4_29879 [Corchorus olitorius]
MEREEMAVECSEVVVGDKDWLMWQCVLAPGVCLENSASMLS